MTTFEPGVRAAAQELMEELMGSVVTLDFVLRTLMGLPEDAFPAGAGAEAIREQLTASAYREAEAVGEEACRAATALIRAAVERMADDAGALARCVESTI